MENLIQDLRYALRQLRKAPGFASAAILILALGIGGTSAIFSTLNPILFEPLPYPNASRIMMIWYADEDGVRSPQAFHTYRELAERNRSFEAVAVMKTWQPTLVGWSVDKDQPIVRVTMMDDVLAASAAERRFVLILFEAFGLVALMLAATGVYGVLSGSVSERTREIGVRSALGASRRSILTLVLRQGMTLTGLGALIGLAGAIAASEALGALLFGVSPLDPLTYSGVIGVLALVSAIASSVPAWRAARIDPMVALRYE